MAFEPWSIIREFDASEPQGSIGIGSESVDVVAQAGAYFRGLKVGRQGDLAVLGVTGDDFGGESCGFEERDVVGEFLGHLGVGGQKPVASAALGSLRRAEFAPIQESGALSDRVGDGDSWVCGTGPGHTFDDGLDDGLADKGSGCVVDQHDLVVQWRGKDPRVGTCLAARSAFNYEQDLRGALLDRLDLLRARHNANRINEGRGSKGLVARQPEGDPSDKLLKLVLAETA